MLVELLHTLHKTRKPRVIMGLRLQDPLPEWVSHIALVQSGRVQTGPKALILDEVKSELLSKKFTEDLGHLVGSRSIEKPGSALVEMEGLNVRYGERHVRQA